MSAREAKPTPAMARVLISLYKGQGWPAPGSASAAGGANGTLMALFRRGWISRGNDTPLTEEGRKVAARLVTQPGAGAAERGLA